eukprot:1193516-Prorocentrum_minimum.AAC.4
MPPRPPREINTALPAVCGLTRDSVAAVQQVWASCSNDPPDGRRVRGVRCILQCGAAFVRTHAAHFPHASANPDSGPSALSYSGAFCVCNGACSSQVKESAHGTWGCAGFGAAAGDGAGGDKGKGEAGARVVHGYILPPAPPAIGSHAGYITASRPAIGSASAPAKSWSGGRSQS